MESWLTDHYLQSQFRIPDPILQRLLDTWVKWKMAYGRYFEKEEKSVAANQNPTKIAELSDALMKIHYEMPAALFQSFLGPSMKYSMALWENGAKSLEEAQTAMLEDLCFKADIKDGSTILDIGCGFGSFAAHVLANYPNCEVYGLNLSKVHCEYIREKQADEEQVLHSKRFQLIEGDFNDFTSRIRFDRVVSIGFFEHVANLRAALEKIRSFLSPSGQCFLHYIVKNGPPRSVEFRDNFIQKYIFPGSHIYSFLDLFKYQESLYIADSWYLNGSNYRRTLEAWLQNFLKNQTVLFESGLLTERSSRIWDLYFHGCIAVFGLRSGAFYGNGQYRLLP